PCPASWPDSGGGEPPPRPARARPREHGFASARAQALTPRMPLLETRDLTRHFGGLAAVNHVDLTVEKGEIVGLLGPNGAGKTTCFNLLSGFLRPTAGSIVFDGENITGLRPHQIAARGLVRTFQLTTLFQEMTALQNVLLGLHLHSGTGL